MNDINLLIQKINESTPDKDWQQIEDSLVNVNDEGKIFSIFVLTTRDSLDDLFSYKLLSQMTLFATGAEQVAGVANHKPWQQ